MRHSVLWLEAEGRWGVSLALFQIFNNKRIVRQVFNEERSCLISHAATVLCCGYVLSCNHSGRVCVHVTDFLTHLLWDSNQSRLQAASKTLLALESVTKRKYMPTYPHTQKSLPHRNRDITRTHMRAPPYSSTKYQVAYAFFYDQSCHKKRPSSPRSPRST